MNVTTNDVDDEDPSCFMFGTVATQKIDVTNTGPQAVNATSQCSVPSGLLRVSGTDPSRTVAAGATETLRCGLYDFQDPPDTGASVTDFTVSVNGATSTHTVSVQCRPQQTPVNRCASIKIGTAGRVGASSLRAYSRYVKTGRSEPLLNALGRGEQRLARGYERANSRYGNSCAYPGDLSMTQQALAEMLATLSESLGNASGRCDAGRVRVLGAWYGASMSAWSKSQRRGDTNRLVRSLLRIDQKFYRRWYHLDKRLGSACSPMDLNALRTLVDRPIHSVLDAQGARRPNPDQWLGITP